MASSKHVVLKSYCALCYEYLQLNISNDAQGWLLWTCNLRDRKTRLWGLVRSASPYCIRSAAFVYVAMSMASARSSQPPMAESPGLRVEIALALQPLLSALQGSELVALLTGKESLYEQMHQPAPARFSASGLPLYLAPPNQNRSRNAYLRIRSGIQNPIGAHVEAGSVGLSVRDSRAMKPSFPKSGPVAPTHVLSAHAPTVFIPAPKGRRIAWQPSAIMSAAR